MKSIIRQFRLSSALDDGRSPAEVEPRDQADQEFLRELKSLEQQLESTPPCLTAPPELHDAIVEKVRSAQGAPRAGRAATAGHVGWLWCIVAALQRRSVLWLAPASAALVIAALLTAVHSQRHQPAQVSVDKPSRDLAALPASVLSPLSIELENLNQDLKNTTEFLLASVP